MRSFLELVQTRQSDRAYEAGKPIEREVLDRILEAGRLAPSACNGQPWHFTVVTEPALLHDVAKATSSIGLNRFVKDSAALILITLEPTNITSRLGCNIKDKDFPIMDLGIAASYITLAAEDEGVGSCILGWFDDEKIRALCGIEHPVRLVVTLGYAKEGDPLRSKVRKSLDELVSYV